MADRMASHAQHDLLLVASLVGRDVADAAGRRAEALVTACRACASILADLVALATATRTLPHIRRERDFHLTATDATSLRPRGWRRLVQAFGTARDTVSRPLAMGFTTLGVAGLLMGAMPSPARDWSARDTVGDVPETFTHGAMVSTMGDPDLAPADPAPASVLGGAFLVTGLGIGAMRVLVTARRGNHTGPGAV